MPPTCPTCQAAPPSLVACDACEEEFAPFVTAGACPRCALVWDSLACAACERRALLEAWVPEGAERRAFLARLLGGDAPPADPEVGSWTAAWRRATRVVANEVTDLFAPVDETTDPTPLRAGILEAEDALEAARRGERELAALAPEATASALAIDFEAARKASRSAVDSALRALEGARRDAEELHRRLLDRKRAPLVEPPAPAPIEPNPPPAAQCPSCAWRPDGYPRWRCARCDVVYDAFTTKGRCCARRHVKTCCPACLAWAPIAEWRRAGGGSEPVAGADESTSVAAARSTPITWLASQVAGAFDRSDPRMETVAGSVERAAGATDRAVGQVTDWFASLQDDGVGAARLKAQDWRGVIDECTRTLARVPTNGVALAFRGYARGRLHDDAGARADLDLSLQQVELTASQRAFALRARAQLREEVSDFEGAIADATEAILLEPKEPLGYSARASALWNLERLDEALADVDEELRLLGSSDPHVAYRAALHSSRGAWDQAEADTTGAIERGYRVAYVFQLRAQARLRLGRVDDARADLTAALRLAPTEPDPYAMRAKLRAKTGDLKGALVDLARQRRQDPWGDASSEHVPLVIEAHLRGERDRAISLLRRFRARSTEPEYAALWLALLLGVDDPFPAPRVGWGGALAQLARGEVSFDALLARAAKPGLERTHGPEERACEAHGYAGLLAERDGRQDDARRSYQACVDAGVPWFSESLWATFRLAGVTPRAPAPAPVPTPAPAPAPAPTPASAPVTLTLIDQLERLARLREQGVLTPDEFAAAKRRLLEG